MPDRVREHTQKVYETVKSNAIAYIGENYASKDCTIVEFGRASGYSRRSVQRALSHFDLDWRYALKSTRMIIGAELIGSTDLDIKKIAKKVSYDQPNQFTRCFRSFYGMTPSEYRADIRRQERAEADG